MPRVFAALLVLPFVVAVAPAQPKDDPLDRVTFRLTTTPAAAPMPALKYQFRTPANERLPGNAALDYFRGSLLVPEWPRDPAEAKTLGDTIDRWEEMAVDELPVAELTAYLDKFGGGFEALDAAARRETVDWRQGVPVTQERLNDVLREMGKAREMIRLNGLRVRRDLARNDFDAAARALRSGFRLSRAVGEGSTTIQLLVGTATGAVTLGRANEFVGRPGSPNLYWALASLPKPVIDPRPALEGEADFADRELKRMIPFAGKESFAACREIRDEQYAAFGLPHPQAVAKLGEVRARVEVLKQARPDPVVSVFALTVPAVEKVHYSHVRLGRRVAALTVVEAVRLHAAVHNGTPPANLADITAVPVPTDPYTGRAFEYAARPDGFTLTAPEDPASPGSGLRYVVAFRK